jgi:undecaprenyl-diphosphatase
MMQISEIQQLFLNLSYETFIIPALILGYIWVSSSVFYHAACILLLSILINYILKNIFKIPLTFMPGKNNYSFPSGHMQSASAFYGYLFYKFSHQLVRILCFAVLAGIAWAMIARGYHNYYDIFAGILCSIIIIAIYDFFNLKISGFLPWITLIIASCLMYYMNVHFTWISKNHWEIFYGLWGLVLGEKFFGSADKDHGVVAKVIASGLCLASYFLLKHIFTIKSVMVLLPAIAANMKLMLLGIILPISKSFAALVTKTNSDK